MEASTYQEVRQLRNRQIKGFIHDHLLLNQFHDEIMLQVINISIKQVQKKYGPAPSPFIFFVMGSAGRFEQALWSDQDNGIIYEETSQNNKDYFLQLGNEISRGLHQAGYEYCHGGVMAAESSWCKSLQEWQQQIISWAEEASWEAIRNLLIFVDSRSIYGETEYLNQLKGLLFLTIKKEHLYQRIWENTMFYQKGVGILGQFLLETHGVHTGSLNLKEKALFPFVNAIRFLALKENIFEASTLTRIHQISRESLPHKEIVKEQFTRLLNYRLLYGDHSDYESSHYLLVEKLTKVQRKNVKEIIKTSSSLCQHVRRFAEKEG